ncbi:hypothetical protein WJX72_010949 [[Myrmecia] bisecta]|uniref:GrpE protein homolog n=1 Tax=[Myrmecia] bisecta TaxID=41462 RepID=A0AAW1RAD4_9CHLO
MSGARSTTWNGQQEAVEPWCCSIAQVNSIPAIDDLKKDFETMNKGLAERKAEIDELKDKLLRAYADMENMRERTARQAESSQKFAVQGFVKSLLEVVDNLERAADSLSEDNLAGKGMDGQDMDRDKVLACLNQLHEGVRLTERVLLNALKKNGAEMYKPLGDKFDPNMHSALFQMEDPSREPGTVGAVTKSGCLLHGRVVRPAEVGVVRAP